MARKDLLLRPPTPRERTHRRRAIAASFLVHGLVVAIALGLALFYHEETKRPTGYPPGVPTIILSTLVITAPPAAPPAPPAPETPSPPTPAPLIPPMPEPSTAATPPPVPETKPLLPENALPVLPPVAQPLPPTPTVTQKKPAPHPPAPSHPVTATAKSHAPSQTQEAASSTSSYMPGTTSDFPQPPYPSEAQSMGKTGTVVLNVQFNRQGSVTATEVVQSSGVSILDNSTRSFISAHWHSRTYAGQTVSVPIQYHLQNL